jgi:di/tricarboxylate transporter
MFERLAFSFSQQSPAIVLTALAFAAGMGFARWPSLTARFITARAGSRLAWSDGQTASLTCFSRLPSAHPTARKPP